VDPEQRAKALLLFQSRHLAMRPEIQWRGGGATVIDSGWGMGRRWGGFATAEVIPHPLTADAEWAVFQGPRRLEVPDFLGLTGQKAAHEHVSERIRASRGVARGLHVLGGLGLASTLVGTFAWSNARTWESYETWSTVTMVGTGALVAGFLGGGFAASRATRLTRDFETLDFESTRDAVDAYNEALRVELGLAPTDVYEAIYGAGR
jgi:hypothetical protein